MTQKERKIETKIQVKIVTYTIRRQTVNHHFVKLSHVFKCFKRIEKDEVELSTFSGQLLHRTLPSCAIFYLF